MQFVSYLRVSTDRQGRSGLGLEAQRAAVAEYVQSTGGLMVAEHVEVETGRANERPVLLQSLALCRRLKATLIIAKLDRLSRNVAFVAGLMDAKVPFIAADMPFASPLMLHIQAAFAQHEREQISARTKAALAAAKARGVAMGRNGRKLAEAARIEAVQFAEQLRPRVTELAAEAASLREMASEMNRAGIPSRQAGLWGPSNTARLLLRLGICLRDGDNRSRPT